jgi:hypothetical protein
MFHVYALVFDVFVIIPLYNTSLRMATVVAVARACSFTTIVVYYILICSYAFVDFIVTLYFAVFLNVRIFRQLLILKFIFLVNM